MSGSVGGAIKNTLGASSSANVGKAVAAVAATASSVAAQNPARCERAAVNYTRRNIPSTEDDWMFVGDIREEEIQHGMSILRKAIPGNKALTLEVKAAPPEDAQSASSEDTDSIEASRIIEQTDEDIVYGRPKENVSNSVTNEWFMMEKIIYAAANDPEVQKSIIQSENVQEVLRQLKSGPVTIECGEHSDLLPSIARAAQATVTETEEEKSFLEELMDKLKVSMNKVAQATVAGFNKVKEFFENMLGSPKNSTGKGSSGPSDNGVGKVVVSAVVFVVLVVLLGRAGIRVRPGRL